MNSSVVRFSRWMSISSSVTAAWTDTSSAETGSSATTTRGLPAKARAMPTRCFWPPESWRGRRRSKSRGSFTMSSSCMTRSRTFSLVVLDAELADHPRDLAADACGSG